MGFFSNYLLRNSPCSGVGGSRGKLGEETVLPFGDGDRRTAENTHTRIVLYIKLSIDSLRF